MTVDEMVKEVNVHHNVNISKLLIIIMKYVNIRTNTPDIQLLKVLEDFTDIYVQSLSIIKNHTAYFTKHVVESDTYAYYRTKDKYFIGDRHEVNIIEVPSQGVAELTVYLLNNHLA